MSIAAIVILFFTYSSSSYSSSNTTIATTPHLSKGDISVSDLGQDRLHHHSSRMSIDTEGSCLMDHEPCDLKYRRIVSVADLHGDVDKARRILRAAGIINRFDGWIATSGTMLIQTGDLIDRGPNSLDMVKFFHELQRSAKAFNGTVINLLGNHEVMLLDGTTFYVDRTELRRHGGKRGFLKKFDTGTELGEFLRSMPVIKMVDRTLFVHAGLEPSLVEKFCNDGKVDTINYFARSGVFKKRKERSVQESVVLNSAYGPVWTRSFDIDSPSDIPKACSKVSQTLDAVGGDRMVIGHNVQMKGVPQVQCNGRLILMDVGMSSAMIDGDPVALEISRKQFRIVDDKAEQEDKTPVRCCQQELKFVTEDGTFNIFSTA